MKMWEYFNRILKYNITPDECFYLLGLYYKITPTLIDCKSIKESLIKKKIITVIENNGNLQSIKISNDGLKTIKDLNKFYNKKTKINDHKLMGDNFKDNVEKYRLMFPAKKLPSGKLARNNVNTLVENFRWFFASYKHTWDDIFKATAKYIKEYRKQDWQYMKTSQYFISKQDKHKVKHSELADYCDLIKEGLDDDDFIFNEKVV